MAWYNSFSSGSKESTQQEVLNAVQNIEIDADTINYYRKRFAIRSTTKKQLALKYIDDNPSVTKAELIAKFDCSDYYARNLLATKERGTTGKLVDLDNLRSLLELHFETMKQEDIAKLAEVGLSTLKKYARAWGFKKIVKINDAETLKAKQAMVAYMQSSDDYQSCSQIAKALGSRRTTISYYIRSLQDNNPAIKMMLKKDGTRYYKIDADANIEYQPFRASENVSAKNIQTEPIDTYKAMPAMIRALTAFEPHEHKAVRIDGVDFHNSLNGDKVQKSIAKNKQLHIDRQRTMRKAGAMFTGSTSMDI
jgi:biotin operon repressor